MSIIKIDSHGIFYFQVGYDFNVFCSFKLISISNILGEYLK